jgi:hypothetical protein
MKRIWGEDALEEFMENTDEGLIDDFYLAGLAEDHYLFMMLLCLKFYPRVSLLDLP